MRKGWEIKSLGEIADVEYGFTDKSADEGDYRYVRITDIDDNGELISTEKKYLKHSKEAASFLLQNNDLLMARTGATFAKVLLYKDVEPSVFASYLIRIKFKEKIDNKLYWYFSKTKAYWDQANNLASGAAQPHFNGAAVKQVIFSFPKSLPEQQRIVAILDECFSVIERSRNNAEKNLQNARELFESYLEGVFKGGEWDEVKLSELATDISDGDHMPPPKSEFGVPFITISNINKETNKIDYSDTFKVPIQYFASLKINKRPVKGDVLYTVTGSYGIPVLVEDNFEFCFQRHIGLIRPSEKLNSKLLYYWILSPQAKTQANESATGTAQKTVSLKSLRSFLIPNIPLKQQQSIVRQLDALRAETQKLEAVYRKKLDYLEELKKSILQKAFSGELSGGELAELKTEKVKMQ